MAAKKAASPKKPKSAEPEVEIETPAVAEPVPAPMEKKVEAPVVEAAPPVPVKSEPTVRRIPRLLKRTDWRALGVDALGERLVATQFGRGLFVASARGTPTFLTASDLFGVKVPACFAGVLPANEMPELPDQLKTAPPEEWAKLHWKTKATKEGCAFYFQVVGRAHVVNPPSMGSAEFKVFVVNPTHGVGLLEVTLTVPDAGKTETTPKVAGSATQTTDAAGNPVNVPGMDAAISTPDASAFPLVGAKATVTIRAVCAEVAHSAVLDVTEEFTFEK